MLVAAFVLLLFGDLTSALFLESVTLLPVASGDLCFIWGCAGLAWAALGQLELSR